MSKKHSIYRHLSLPIPLLDKVKNHLINKPEYSDILEFIREAIREKIRRDIMFESNEKRDIEDDFDNEDVRFLPNDIVNFPNIFPEETVGFVS